MKMELRLMIIIKLSVATLSQQMRPGVIVSKDDGVMLAKNVYFGYLDCNNSDPESAQSIRAEMQQLKTQLAYITTEIRDIRNRIQSRTPFLKMFYASLKPKTHIIY